MARRLWMSVRRGPSSTDSCFAQEVPGCEIRTQSRANGINRARASTAAHLLLLRTLGKTCQIKVYDELLNRIANFFNGAFTNIIVSALNEKKIANESLKALTVHQERQRNIIIRHINRQQLAKHEKIMKDHVVAWHAETVGKRKAQEKLQASERIQPLQWQLSYAKDSSFSCWCNL